MNWTKVNSHSLTNLHTCSIGNDIVGFVYKPIDTKTDKCAWVLYLGIGPTCKFPRHSWKKAEAKSIVEKMIADSR